MELIICESVDCFDTIRMFNGKRSDILLSPKEATGNETEGQFDNARSKEESTEIKDREMILESRCGEEGCIYIRASIFTAWVGRLDNYGCKTQHELRQRALFR